MLTIDYRPTHNCGALHKGLIEQEVILSGWVHRRRDMGALIFIDMRDRYGLTQLVFNPTNNPKAHASASKLRSEDVITVRGIVIQREVPNTNLATGEIEVVVHELHLLSSAKTPPFSISDETLEVQEVHRLKYRYLDIRRGVILDNLEKRHKAMLAIRNYMDQQNFLEVTTPILGKSTPEGARDYLVPSRIYPGHFYALPQSPQIFKQLLMCSSLDRYFQFATCFRDEDLRSDRQPEFMQIDIEMSFLTPVELMELAEGLCKEVFKKCNGLELHTPFHVMSHQDAMEKYGTDRPDLRFGMPLVRIDSIAKQSDFSVFKTQLQSGGCVKAICVNQTLSRKEIDTYTEFAGNFGLKGLGWMKCGPEGLGGNIAKFFAADQLKKLQALTQAQSGDTLLFAAEKESIVNQALDHLRRKIAEDLHLIDNESLKFTWVTEFPLFAWDADSQRVVSEHHPFTAPHPDDIDLIESDPLKVRSLAYDLVLNGYEIAGGSQRIHNAKVQEQIFNLLNLSKDAIQEKFGFFVDALQYGTPPHLGIAFGFDRLMMILCGTNNIRDVIAFPKTIKAADLMMEAPAPVQANQLKDLAIQIEK